VIIEDTIFDRITSCGSLIRNQKQVYTPTKPYANMFTASPEVVFKYRLNELQKDVYER